MRGITKIELLWSRACPLDCVGCAMPKEYAGQTSTQFDAGTVGDWERGVARMRELGSEFVAIYGAEPLTRLEGLPQVVNAIYRAGMKATVITALPKSPRLQRLMAESVLDSVTCSYDGAFDGQDRQTKSRQGWEFLMDHPGLRDRACVATITRANADLVPEMAKQATAQGMWFLFDLLHGGTGPLSKCRDDSAEAPTEEQVRRLCWSLIVLKREGFKIHASEAYLTFLGKTYNGKVRETWHCKGQSTGWLTVDADGSILPCDDWQKKFPGGKIWDQNWTAADLDAWKAEAVKDCPGCAWNTHWDACAIQRGDIPVGTYVHE